MERDPIRRSPTEVFAGRERELRELDHALDAAVDGRGRILLLAGDPGIGKTRLSGELAGRASARDARVLWGRCWDGGGAPAYWPWIQILRSLIRGPDGTELVAKLGPGAAFIAQLLPELARVETAIVDDDAARFYLFDAAAQLLELAAQGNPLVLILDDLHWADRPSLLLLDFLASNLSTQRILVVGAYRPLEVREDAELAQTLNGIARRGNVLPLRGLGDDDVIRMVRNAADVDPSDAVLSSLCSLSEGNPFFVDELVRLLQAEERLVISHGVTEVIRRRLAPLPPDTRDLLHDAAVVGREFTLAVLEEAAALPRERVRDALWQAGRLGIVEEAGFGPGTYTFTHALIRETLYEDLSPSRRGQAHLRIGSALEHFYGAQAERYLTELAHHFVQAFQGGIAEAAGRALHYSARAGTAAMQQFAYEHAATQFEHALMSFGAVDPGDDEGHFDLLVQRAEALRLAGDLATSMDLCAHAHAMATRLANPGPAMAHAALGFEEARWEDIGLWRLPESVKMLRSALAALDEDDIALRSAVLGRLVRPLHFLSLPEDNVAIGRQAVELAESTGDPRLLAAALDGLSWAMSVPEHAADRVAVVDRLIATASEAGDLAQALSGRIQRTLLLLELGRIDELDAEIAVYARDAAGPHRPFYEWWTSALRANRALMAGRFDDVEAELVTLREAADRGGLMALGAISWFESGVGWLRGDPHLLKAALESVAPLIPAPAFHQASAVHIATAFGDREKARQAFAVAATGGFTDIPRNIGWMSVLAVLASCSRFAGDAAAAEALYRLLTPYAGRVVVVVPVGFLTTSHWLGVLSVAAGRFDDAARHFEEALDLHERFDAPAWVAVTRCEYGEMLVEHGDAERGHDLLRLALETSEKLGMEAVAERARVLLPSFPTEAEDETVRFNVFRPEGEWWTIAFGGRACRLNATKGLAYLRQLLANPGRELHALQLVTVVDGGLRGDACGVDFHADSGRSEALLDEASKRAYRLRMEGLREDIEEADSFSDFERAANARAELDAITEELSASVGLGGRDRRAAGEAERARLNVTRAIRSAVDRIAHVNPPLGQHLTALVRTGNYCCYTTDPTDPITWTTD